MTNTTHEEYLVAYFANAMTAEDCLASIGTEQSDANSEILATAQREWDEVECDPEGATSEQDARLDRIIEDCLSDLL